jgi:hypothetical protein
MSIGVSAAGVGKDLVVPELVGAAVTFILWLIAVALVVTGIVSFVRRQWLSGLALIVFGFLVGPGGVSIFT